MRTEYSSTNVSLDSARPSSGSSSATIFVKPTSALSQPNTSQTPSSHYQIPAGYASIPALSAADISSCSPGELGRPEFSRGDNAKPATLAPKLHQVQAMSSLPPDLLAQLEYSSQLSQMAMAANGGGGEGWNRKHVILAPSSGGGGGNQGQLILLPVSSTTSPLYQTSLNNIKSEPSLSPQNLSLKKDNS